jgi:hypothetical protein
MKITLRNILLGVLGIAMIIVWNGFVDSRTRADAAPAGASTAQR